MRIGLDRLRSAAGRLRAAGSAALLLTLAACATGPYDADAVRELPPQDSAFLAELSREYVALGDLERAEYDWRDTAAFYGRALRAAQGEVLAPEALDDRDLTPEAREQLAEARTRLVGLFSAGARSIAGGASARGQAGFDCWMQEREEGHQPADIEACRAAFLAAVAEIESMVGGALVVLLPDTDGEVGVIQVRNPQGTVDLASDRASAVTDADAAPQASGIFLVEDVDAVFGEALAASPEPPIVFLLYFEQGSDVLTAESARKMTEVLEAVGRRALPQVEVSGHTDTSGSAAFNDRLAQDRAELVAQEVLGLGVPERVVTVISYGERDPVVPTADGVSEPQNRRVEIVIR